MANELSQITLPNNTTYNLKDSSARTTLDTKPGLKIANGTTTTYDGVTYTAGDGCEIFNDYTNNKVANNYSHAEGYATKALGYQSHTEGYHTTTTNYRGHAEGYYTVASGDAAHVEGNYSTASGDNSHAENDYTTASGNASHAEGTHAIASGYASHAEGCYTEAASDYQHAQGKFNIVDSDGDYAFIIGNGTASDARSNAFAVDWDGKVYVNNDTTGVDVSTIKNHITIGNVFGTGTALTTGQDLNNITTLGPYNANTGTIAQSLLNCPTGSPFRLEVSTLNGSTRYVQKIYVVNSVTSLTTIFIRSYTSSGWTGWNKIGDDSALIQYINNGPKNVANPLSAQGYDGQGNFPITKGNIKYTLNANGTITTENTASATTTLKIPVKLVNGETYTISGCPSGGTSTSYRLDIRLAGTTTVKASDYGDGADFTATQENYDLCIRYQSGQAAAQTFSPMICLSAVYALTPKFVQYIPSNAELYAMIQAL